jgi:transposase
MQERKNELTGPMRRVEARLGHPLNEWLRERYERDGLTTTQIAVELGLSGVTVWRWLRYFGVEPRFPGQRGRAS